MNKLVENLNEEIYVETDDILRRATMNILLKEYHFYRQAVKDNVIKVR